MTKTMTEIVNSIMTKHLGITVNMRISKDILDQNNNS